MVMEAMTGSTVNIEYFSRQMRLPGLGLKGQERLAQSRVLIVGMGALGHPVSLALALAGVGHLSLMDPDRVELSNLHRQPLFTPEDCGELKVDRAAARLKQQLPQISLEAYGRFFTGSEEDQSLMKTHDLILDCTDRFSSKFLLHDHSYHRSKPFFSASVSGFFGHVHFFPFHQRRGQCWRCLYPQAPGDDCVGSCAQDGILGASASLVGNLMALAALRQLLGWDSLEPFVTYALDLASFGVEKIGWSGRADCSMCQGKEIQPTASLLSPAVTSFPSASAPAPTAHGSPPAAHESLVIVDLREPFEVQPQDRYFFPEARRLPLGEFLKDLDSWPREGSYLLLCEYGQKSRTAAYEMKRQGFERVRDLAGGYQSLRSQIRS